MRILVANDDGIYSPGILALARVASRFGHVRIVAPDVERSSAGQSISSMPLTSRRTPMEDFEAYRVNGTPADCVALGMHLWERVDLVVSGVNIGANLGNSIWHSGTVAAAKQAALLGVRGIAFSTPVEPAPRWDALAVHVEESLRVVLHEPDLMLVNVNIPAEPAGCAWTRQSVRHYDGTIVPGTDPMGRTHYWFTVRPIEETEEGTDRWAVQRGMTSLTPLRLDLTDGTALARLRKRQQE